MNQYDEQYNALVSRIITEGVWDKDQNVRTRWADGTPAYTKSILNAQMNFDNGAEALLLSTKIVPRKDPLNELFWIWKYKSNDVKFLREKLGCKVWDSWMLNDNTIGKSYGWQLRNKFRKVKITNKLSQMAIENELNDVKLIDGEFVYLDQVDYLIYTLKTNAYSRRIKTTLWCVEDLDNMALEPCVYETHWQVWNGKLHLTVCIRSNDAGLGNPYNIYQYSVLHRMIAQVTGHLVGTICFNIDNLHVYDRHIDALTEQIQRPTFEVPTLWVNPEIKSFYDFTINDFKLEGYQAGPSIKLEVAI